MRIAIAISVVVCALPLFSGGCGIADERIGVPQDWSARHVIYTGPADETSRDPRVRARHRSLLQPAAARSGDWSVDLITRGHDSGLSEGAYPAKFSFFGPPDCNTDFIALGLNVNGQANQANLVAFRNLYSNPSGTGFCTTTGPTVKFAYNVGAHPIPTSVVLSLDGTKVAYVLDTTPPVFSVITPVDGGTVSAPQPAPTGAALRTLTLAGANDCRHSAPYIDYETDTAFIGSSNGLIYRIHPVFNGAPALDPAWTTNPVQIAGNPKLTAVVFDPVSDGLFTGGFKDGDLYRVRASDGGGLKKITFGSGGNGKIPEGVIVDVTNQVVYAFTGDDGTSSSVIQTPTSFVGAVKRPIGQRNIQNVHLGTFDDPYFTSSTSTDWSLYVCGFAGAGNKDAELYRVSFTAGRILNRVTDLGAIGTQEECSPLTEFKDGAHDRLFVGLSTSNLVRAFDITTVPTAPATALASKASSGGTSGITVDNSSGLPETTSVYYTTRKPDQSCGGDICLVKRTQDGLN